MFRQPEVTQSELKQLCISAQEQAASAAFRANSNRDMHNHLRDTGGKQSHVDYYSRGAKAAQSVAAWHYKRARFIMGIDE